MTDRSQLRALLRLRLRIVVMLRLAMIAAIALEILAHEWRLAFVTCGALAVAMLPIVFRRRFNVLIPVELETLAVVVIFASLFLGEIRDYYERVWWWDKAIHTTSGFVQGIVGFLLVYVLNEARDVEVRMKSGFVAFFAFCFSVMLGTVWEIFEFAMDVTFGLNMQKSGLVDTMWDLIVTTIGALTISYLGYTYLKTVAKDSFLERWIEKFIDANPSLFRS